MDTLLIGRKEAARLLNLSLRSLDFAVGQGFLRARRLGRRVTFTPEELHRFAARDYKRIAPPRAVITKNTEKS
jgi:excisionase family DNA binding protein